MSRRNPGEVLLGFGMLFYGMHLMSEAMMPLENRDIERAQRVLLKDPGYAELETEYRKQHVMRVRDEVSASITTHEIHMEIMDLLKQIHFHTAEMAKTIVNYIIPENM